MVRMMATQNAECGLQALIREVREIGGQVFRLRIEGCKTKAINWRRRSAALPSELVLSDGGRTVQGKNFAPRLTQMHADGEKGFEQR
jgi:hypothetical protein